jgi:hypothetical protein
MDAVLMYNGLPVRTSSELNSYDFSNDYTIGISGTLDKFTLFNKEYKYYSDADLRPIHQPKPNGQHLTTDALYWKAGYYEVEVFKQYKNGEILLGELVDIDSSGNKAYGFELILSKNGGWGFEYAKKGDIVTVRRLDPIPYDSITNQNYRLTNYYNLKEYKFKLNYDDSISDFPNRFTKVSQFPPINDDETSEDYSIINDIINIFNNRPTAFFYLKNFTELYTNWGLNDEFYLYNDEEFKILSQITNPNQLDNKRLSNLVTCIAFRIAKIRDEILSKIAIEDIWVIEQAYYNYIIENEEDYDEFQADDYWVDVYINLTQVDKLIASLLRNWGRLTAPNNYNQSVTVDFNPIFSETLDYKAMLKYYQNLDNFYRKLFAIDETKEFPPTYAITTYTETGPTSQVYTYTPDEDSKRRIRLLASILPGDSFSVFPIEDRINLIDPFLTQQSISEEDQRTIVNIIYSINAEANAQLFLDYLLKTKPGSADINFKLLYDRLDDARIERYLIANWFVDHQTNKKHFIYALYNLWKLTSYNAYHISAGTTANSDGLNPNAYFLNEGQKYYIEYNDDGTIKKETEAILEFESNSELSSNLYISIITGTSRYFKIDEELKKELITIYDVKESSFSSSDTIVSINTIDEIKKFAEYHIYQPIVLVGYKADLELTIPDLTSIPAFLFYYAVEFDKIKDFDTAFNFAAEVALEVVLFFAFGGLGALRHLRHLKYANKIGAALRNTLVAEEAVVVWKGVFAGAEVLSLEAGILYSTSQLIANSTNDQATHDAYKTLGTCLLVLTFASAGGSIYSARRASKYADEVIAKVDELSNANIPHGIDQEVLDVLYSIKNAREIDTALFKNMLNSFTDIIPPNTTTKVFNVFENVFNDAEREVFENFFSRFLTDLSPAARNTFLELIEQDDAIRMLNWQTLKNLEVPDISLPRLLSDLELSTAYIRYFEEDVLKLKLIELPQAQRIKFIELNGNISQILFSEFISKPSIINNFFRYYDDDIIKQTFRNLSKVNQIKLLKLYGDCSETVLNNIRYSPNQHINKYLLKFDDPPHSTEYFVTRRGEMLPPPFGDARTGKHYGVHEVDSFIELEIIYGATVRASRSNEAGDVVIEGSALINQSLDPMGIPHYAVQPWIDNYTRQLGGFERSMKRHFEKITDPKPGLPALDKVVIDFKYMDDISPNLKQHVLDFVETNYPQFNNATYLIKLNL